MWKWLYRILIIISIIILSLRIADKMARRSNPLPIVPKKNGYDTLLAVTHMMTLPQVDLAELQTNVILEIGQANRAIVDKLHPALRSESGVPLKTAPGWVDNHTEDVKRLKQLAVVLGLQARAEMLEGNTNQAAKYLLDTIFLGHALARGGILSDGINALSVEAIGAVSLRSQIPYLNAEFCRTAAQELEQGEARRESADQILKTQNDWSSASYGLVSRIGGFFLRKTEAERHAEFKRRYQEITRLTRRLILSLGARAIELETGQPVTDPAQLVPGILKAVPIDPETNTPMTDIPGPPA